MTKDVSSGQHPARNPLDERERLLHVKANNLLVINHFCFGGGLNLKSGFRCLVAGGQTGDGLIYLAEQLREFDAEIVYLDVSAEARDIAEKRAEIRELDNISWITGSILDLPGLNLGEFDYIHCAGELHRLEAPEDGLRCLLDVLKTNGAMFLMLNAKYGRASIHEIQELLRHYLPENISTDEKISMAKRVIDCLPETNPFKRDTGEWESEISAYGDVDAAIYDLLLCPSGQAFDVNGLYELTGKAGLQILGFPESAQRYDPYVFIDDESVLGEFEKLTERQLCGLAELMRHDIKSHEIYVSRENNAATIEDDENALVLFWGLRGGHRQLAEAMIPGKTFTLKIDDYQISINCSEILRHIFGYMDGKTAIRDMVDRIKEALPFESEENIRQELEGVYEILSEFGLLYLCKPGVQMPDYARIAGG